jgi:hypothetical protein
MIKKAGKTIDPAVRGCLRICRRTRAIRRMSMT